jgi:hypothetical protein
MTAALLFALPGAFAQAQQIDINEMMKWSQAQLIRYHIEGVYDKKTALSSLGTGFGDVKDRVVIDMNWDLASGLVGTASFTNTATTVTNLKDFEPACYPPILKGPYEFYDVVSIKQGNAMTLLLQVKTTHPVVEVAQFCTASRKAVPASVVGRPEELVIPSPVLFGQMAPGSTLNDLTVSKDRKQLIYRNGGWTWTFTPTIAKK